MRDEPPQPRTSRLATASLLCGIAGILIGLSTCIVALAPPPGHFALETTSFPALYTTLFLGILAIGTGYLAEAQIRKHPELFQSYRRATGGTTMGYIATLASLFILVFATPAIMNVKEYGPISRNMHRARTLHSALTAYAKDHDGNFPPDLAAMERSNPSMILADSRFHGKGGNPHDWIYHSGLTRSSHPDSIILASPEIADNGRIPRRIIVRVIGTVHLVLESEYQSRPTSPSP